jgi:hypothetical protein
LDFANCFNFIAFASAAGGQRNRNAAAFCSLKKLASHFFNPHFARAEPKEAANPVTDCDQNRYAILCIYLNEPAVSIPSINNLHSSILSNTSTFKLLLSSPFRGRRGF